MGLLSWIVLGTVGVALVCWVRSKNPDRSRNDFVSFGNEDRLLRERNSVGLGWLPRDYRWSLSSLGLDADNRAEGRGGGDDGDGDGDDGDGGGGNGGDGGDGGCGGCGG